MKRAFTIVIAVIMMFSMVALFVPALQLFAGPTTPQPAPLVNIATSTP